jgi:hypothetical protein
MARLTNAELLERFKDKPWRLMNPTERIEFLSHAPGVTRLDKAEQCTASKSGLGRKSARLCMTNAYWKFKGLNGDPDGWGYNASGTYCFMHLVTRGIHGNMREDDRYNRWLIRVGFIQKEEKE